MKSKIKVRQKAHLHKLDGGLCPFYINFQTVKHLGEINGNLTLEQAHTIADALEKNIYTTTKYSTIIHLDPKETLPNTIISKRIIETILNKQKDIISFHKIQIIHETENNDIKMHIIVDKDMPVEQSHKICHRLKEGLQYIYGTCNVDIHFEPCNHNCKICTISCKKRKT